jgi:uroporphyrinogen-III synthase
LRVLVTRPKITAARTAERLQAMGHEPVLLPLSEASHDPQSAIDALREPHALIAVTSAETLRVLADPRIRDRIDLDRPLFAVGEATAAAARAFGFRHVRSGSGGGQELADLIASSAAPVDLPILYLAGAPRSSAFEDRLQRIGLPVRTREIYRMQPVGYDPAEISARLAIGPVDAVLLYSRETALRFFDLMSLDGQTLAAARILCISERTAEAVPARLAHAVVIADRPDEDALLALL